MTLLRWRKPLMTAGRAGAKKLSAEQMKAFNNLAQENSDILLVRTLQISAH